MSLLTFCPMFKVPSFFLERRAPSYASFYEQASRTRPFP
jgi:hypothetical protein